MSYSAFIIELKKALAENTDFAHEIVFIKSDNSATDKYGICVPELNTVAVPGMGLDYFYDEYQKGRSIEEIADSIEEIYLSKFGDSKSPNLVWDSIKKHLIYHIINFNDNANSIAKCPYFQIGDMAVVFKINAAYLGIDGYIPVTYEVYEMLKVDMVTLVETALENTPAIFPLSFIKINDIFPDLNSGILTEERIFYKSEFWVASTTSGQNGASAILYNKLSELLNAKGYSDAYIIPLSIHEVLVVGYNEAVNKEMLSDMLIKSNNSPLITKEIHLSDIVYLYSDLKNKFETELRTLKANILL